MENTFSIKQVSNETGLSIHTLRYYEQIGLIGEIPRDEHGYRAYSQSDILWFHIIKHYRSMGMPIRELQQFDSLQGSGLSLTSARRKFLEDYRCKVVEQLKKFEETLEKIDYKIDLFKQLEAADKQQSE